MARERILIVDDEAPIRKLIIKSISQENYIIEEASSGESALKKLQSNSFDLIILDVMLEDMDGFELIKEIKMLGIKNPIIFVTGRDEDYDKILGLGLGADNYITKPFSPAILCAYVKAQLRTYKSLSKHKQSDQAIIQGPFKFDLQSHTLYKNQEHISLSSIENQLIKFLMENPQQVFTKQQIYERVWKDHVVDDNAIMVYIHNLRKKIEINPKFPKHIVTVWGIGYKFMP